MRYERRDDLVSRRTEIRLGRAIRELLRKGMTPKEVAKLLDFEESSLMMWVQIADEELH